MMATWHGRLLVDRDGILMGMAKLVIVRGSLVVVPMCFGGEVGCAMGTMQVGYNDVPPVSFHFHHQALTSCHWESGRWLILCSR